MKSDETGIIVIGRNEGQRLINCLNSVRGSDATLVYVDSGSTDGSTEAAIQLGALTVNLDMTRPFTAARARNAGFSALKNVCPDVRLVQFVDGDCELAHDWIGKATAFLKENPNVAVVCGRRRERYPEASIYNELCDIEWDTPIGEAAACGGDSLVRTGAFEAVGGFRDSLMAGEEPELCLRLREQGWKIWRLDTEMTLHDAAITRFSQWWRRAVRGGYGYAELSRLYQGKIYHREMMRALLWGVGIPTAIALGTVLHPTALAAALIYPLQILRIAARRSLRSAQSWKVAFFLVMAKFPEAEGVLKFHLGRMRGKLTAPIEYKQAG